MANNARNHRKSLNSDTLLKSINAKAKTIKCNSHIAEEFNKYFRNIGPNLTSKIQNTSKAFKNFLFPVGKNMVYRGLFFE